jgi:lipooligosaccharide transport system permease protein
MSLINTGIDTAISIAERRRGKLGSALSAGRPQAVFLRNVYALKSSNWLVVISGFVEQVFYLLAFGYGLGTLIGNIALPDGTLVPYAAYIAPALLATSAMNGAIYDSTWNVFFKMHFGKIYQAMLSTSLGPLDVAMGEIGWALARGFVYALGFMAVVTPMGLIPSWWGLLAIPAAVLIAFGFASIGMGVTSYLKNFHQMDWVNFVMLPMFLFSGTFYSLSVYPDWLRICIESLPLYQAIAMIRGFTLGIIDGALVGHILYFVVMIVLGLTFTTRRLRSLFLK